MKLSRKQFARASLVALAALALAVPAWAGQVNLGARTTLILETVTELGASTLSSTITSTGITEAGGGSISSTATSSINITEIFNSASATVSFEVAQEDLNYTSPFDNLLITSLIQQSVNVTSSGLTNVQVTGGAGNVSVASNGLLSGIALGSITGTLGQSFAAGGTQVLTLAITPGFALQNSNANALTQAAAVAVAGGAAGAAVSALDIQQSGVNEYSPHGNVALIAASINQVVTVGSATGITNVGVQAGAGNVQAAHTNILFHTGPSSISNIIQ
jgi:hypothetical protein